MSTAESDYHTAMQVRQIKLVIWAGISCGGGCTQGVGSAMETIRTAVTSRSFHANGNE
jgi:hypothetical protein